MHLRKAKYTKHLFKNYLIESLNQGLQNISFGNFEVFSDTDTAYFDFIKDFTSVI